MRDPQIASIKARVGARRGRNIGRVAAARHLLTLVYYGLRDGEIRCLVTSGVDRATAIGQLGNGMTHHLVRSSQMSELPVVVTARLHVTRHCGVTKVCPGTRTAGCHHLDSN